ncbi:hypothetical protein ZIOFF_074276 (mitochondrion) [Zingiber officinale]|uniref:Uncharacterized protein n=1 Tax=Zingiber officinale TaxID=94328 RepID=A0A8J5BYM1_ZINOF|nr:hypothetical protein ZIOFF_074276 [Zingiber officinale]
MDIAQRLSTIQNEISNLENEKSEREQALGLLWEHPPPLDPQIVGAVMLELRNRISALEERRKLLLVEQKELLVQAANHPRPRSLIFNKNEDINPTRTSHRGMNPDHFDLAQKELAQLGQPTTSQWACEFMSTKGLNRFEAN